MKAPIPPNEAERLAALRSYAILDTATEAVYDDIAGLVAFICNVPIATISFVDKDRQWFKSRIGVQDQQTSRDIAFCAHTILTDEPLVVPDAAADTRFADSTLVTEEPKIRFYAGFPLTTPDGFNLGALCAIDRAPRELDARQRKAMAALARQVMALMELRKVSAQLADTLKAVKTLEGLLPICAWCKRIRDDNGYWNRLEAYISNRTGAEFTHGICPECLNRLGPETRQGAPA